MSAMSTWSARSFVALLAVATLTSGCMMQTDPWPGTYLGTDNEVDTPCGGSPGAPGTSPLTLRIERGTDGLLVSGIMCTVFLDEQSATYATVRPGSCDASASGAPAHFSWTGGDARLSGAMLTYRMVFHVVDSSLCYDVAVTFNLTRQ